MCIRDSIEGVSKRMYTDEELANIDGPPVQYKGKTYTAYEATQRQRQLERTMRKYKRELLAYEAAGIGPEDEDSQAAAIRLQSYSREYKAFSAAAHLTQPTERARCV